MCGFGGAINHHRFLNKSKVANIASKVSFRGPDSCGIRVFDEMMTPAENGNTAIFFNRLAIIDLDSRSNQPFEDERHLLTFNGEIYNYQELRAALESEGVTFVTTSDTEVLFFALKYWGKKALPKLNGMFAFFWLDKQQQTFMICRDRLGIKPLYYHQEGGSFYFASELYSIVRFLDKKPDISHESVQMYLWMQFIPTPHTILKGIFKLPPGNFIEGRINALDKAIQPQSYWDAYAYLHSIPEKKERAGLEDVLKGSIERQMQADVPLGLFLSSGVDSSLLAALVNKYFASDNEVNFFTISFNEPTITDESQEAISFIKGFNNPRLRNHLLKVDANYLQDQLTNLYEYYDEPFGDYASILNKAISTKAREYVTVAISGDGADEMFWGYPRYNQWQALNKWNSIPALSSIINGSAGILPSSSLKYKIRKTFQPDGIKRHFDLFLLPGIGKYAMPHISEQALWAMKGAESVSNRKDLPAILDIKTYLADAMLYKVDRSSMAASLEVRVPYLDNETLEYALALSFDQKSNARFANKAILKELLLTIAPHYDANRPKKGFSFPIEKWLKTNWKENVLSSITAPMLNSIGLNAKPLLSMVDNFYSGSTNYAVDIWYLFNLALWKRHYDQINLPIG